MKRRGTPEADLQRSVVTALKFALPKTAIIHHCANEVSEAGPRGARRQAILVEDLVGDRRLHGVARVDLDRRRPGAAGEPVSEPLVPVVRLSMTIGFEPSGAPMRHWPMPWTTILIVTLAESIVTSPEPKSGLTDPVQGKPSGMMLTTALITVPGPRMAEASNDTVWFWNVAVVTDTEPSPATEPLNLGVM